MKPTATRLAVFLFYALTVHLAIARFVVANEADVRGDASERHYLARVKPILTRYCVRCHGPDTSEAGLRLDSGAAILRGGNSGTMVVAGDTKRSRLLGILRGEDEDVEQMPPEGPVPTEEEIAQLVRWISAGAHFPADEQLTPRTSSHWSLQPPVRPQLPVVDYSSWMKNPIDAFVVAQLEAHGLQPSSPAERATLIRRVSLDLIGVPPTVEETEAFLRDPRPDSYERLVDRLLASPAYGERWGRHWLDLARYADSNGFTRDFAREIWRYRDWVIAAVNAGMPFDRFTIEQFAGDMLPEADLNQKIATGFHRNTLINEEGGTDQEQFRVDAVADRIATTGVVFLGLTLGCARCHEHKFDPISQRRLLPNVCALEQLRRALRSMRHFLGR